MEAVLAALCGCTSVDVVSILEKKREPITGLTVSATAEQAPAPPRVFTRIHLVYRIAGKRDQESRRRCGVALEKQVLLCFAHAGEGGQNRLLHRVRGRVGGLIVFRAFKFAVVVLVLAVLAMLSAIVTMHFAIHGAEVTVPSFKGLTVAEATDKAAALGLNLTVDNHFYSVEIPAGRILNQSPSPGTVVRREWRVRLTESVGPQRVAIPNLTGSNQRLASIQIRRIGLEVGANGRDALRLRSGRHRNRAESSRRMPQVWRARWSAC